LICPNSNCKIILWRAFQGSNGMAFHELRVGLGLFLAFALIIGGSLGIGLPLAAVIIWLLS
jgi:hypothetical protein